MGNNNDIYVGGMFVGSPSSLLIANYALPAVIPKAMLAYCACPDLHRSTGTSGRT